MSPTYYPMHIEYVQYGDNKKHPRDNVGVFVYVLTFRCYERLPFHDIIVYMGIVQWNEELDTPPDAPQGSRLNANSKDTLSTTCGIKAQKKAVKSVKKPKPRTMKSIEKELWELCRQIRYTLDNKDGRIDCYTCRAWDIQSSNRQLGHCRPKGACHAWGKYNLDNLRFQCYKCNINWGGMGSEFRRRLIEENGEAYVTDFERQDSQTIVNARDHYLLLIEQYKLQLKNHP